MINCIPPLLCFKIDVQNTWGAAWGDGDDQQVAEQTANSGLGELILPLQVPAVLQLSRKDWEVEVLEQLEDALKGDNGKDGE